MSNIVFKEILPKARLLILEVFGKQVWFHVQENEVKKFCDIVNEGISPVPLSLEVKAWYEDEIGETWQVTARCSYSPCDKVIEYYYLAKNKDGILRRHNADGTYCEGFASEYPQNNLVRRVEPQKAIAGGGITRKTLAEKLRETAVAYHSVEMQAERIKEAAREAANNGALKMQVDTSVYHSITLQNELTKCGFSVYGEFQTNPFNISSDKPRLVKVWLSWEAER